VLWFGQLTAAPGSHRAGDTWPRQPVLAAAVVLGWGPHCGVAGGDRSAVQCRHSAARRLCPGGVTVPQDMVSSPRSWSQGCPPVGGDPGRRTGRQDAAFARALWAWRAPLCAPAQVSGHRPCLLRGASLEHQICLVSVLRASCTF